MAFRQVDSNLTAKSHRPDAECAFPLTKWSWKVLKLNVWDQDEIRISWDGAAGKTVARPRSVRMTKCHGLEARLYGLFGRSESERHGLVRLGGYFSAFAIHFVARLTQAFVLRPFLFWKNENKRHLLSEAKVYLSILIFV